MVGKDICDPAQFVFYNRSITFPEPGSDGIFLETAQDKLNPRIRYHELLIPWGMWGGPNGSPFSSQPSPGTRLAMSFGYNDKDLVDEPLASAIRWRNAADPYTTGVNPLNGATTTVDSWGDLLLSEGLTEAMQNAGGTMPDCPNQAVRHPLATQRTASALRIISSSRSGMLFECPLPFQTVSSLDILDCRGVSVRHLAFSQQLSGANTIVWDRRDNHGLPVSCGNYLAHLRIGHGDMTVQVAIVR